MALQIKWQYNGVLIDAYVKILAINTRRQAEGSNDFRRSGVSSPINSMGIQLPKDFHFDVIYAIYANPDDANPISRGNLTAPYDLNSTQNIFEYCYSELKLRVEDMKDAINV